MPELAPFPDVFAPDILLSETFHQNAAVKLDCAVWAAKESQDNLALHSIAIATELLLKSYLLRTASTDDWNRVQIGHDLDSAARRLTRGPGPAASTGDRHQPATSSFSARRISEGKSTVMAAGVCG